MEISIIRVEQTDNGTFGVLLLKGMCFCVTLELPWYDNENNISCIPDGEYICSKHDSPTRGEVWQIENVPNRKYIYFHAGNTLMDTLGCIVLGQYFDKLRGNRAVLNSGKTYNKFMAITKQEDILELTIATYEKPNKIQHLNVC